MTSYHGPSRTVIIVHDGWTGNVFHYNAQIVGAKYVSRSSGRPDLTNSTETWIKLGNFKVMTIANYIEEYAELDKFKVDIGDEIWVLGTDIDLEGLEIVYSKIPQGLGFFSIPSTSSNIRMYRLVKSQNIENHTISHGFKR
ncbi:Serine/threonine protein kinase [Candidatus Scalindua japonica]|uniref:Serine/threonine protein kinase n=2 Tax=Candidatus Scalindua japonica TaxID=1284222 RepID=A0A286TX94_9BACT|nr:Serine/threonine protein kinase [Candidatus Scalindua japonica]